MCCVCGFFVVLLYYSFSLFFSPIVIYRILVEFGVTIHRVVDHRVALEGQKHCLVHRERRKWGISAINKVEFCVLIFRPCGGKEGGSGSRLP